jgi:selenocysteine lyase/cysteine desulfurase
MKDFDSSSSPSAGVHPAAGAFPSPGVGRTFINAAYMSPEPIAALEAMRQVLGRMASPDFGPEAFFEPGERVRALLASIVGGLPGAFSLTGAASYGMATLAWNLRVNADELVGPRRRIVGVNGQFPSNVYTWRRLETCGFELVLVPGGEGVTKRLIEAIDEHTALVAFAPLSWTDGLRVDFVTVCRAAREHGALSLLDVTQSAGADSALDDDLPVDVVVGAGYKWLLGPYGTGFMRLTTELQARLEPLEANWKNFEGSSDFNRLTEYADSYAGPAAKFDHGESSAFLRLAGWEVGLEALLEFGEGEVARHAARFAAGVREALDPGRFEISVADPRIQAQHLFRVAPLDSGTFEPLSVALSEAGISISKRNGGWRISPHLYNGLADIDAIAAVLG